MVDPTQTAQSSIDTPAANAAAAAQPDDDPGSMRGGGEMKTPEPAPDFGGLPAGPVPAQAPGLGQGPTRQPTAKDAVDAHHNMLGKVASALLGKQVDYRINPQTGQSEAYEVPQKPGDLFRHILAGALIGGAAAKGQNSVLGGFAAGGKA